MCVGAFPILRGGWGGGKPVVKYETGSTKHFDDPHKEIIGGQRGSKFLLKIICPPPLSNLNTLEGRHMFVVIYKLSINLLTYKIFT